MVPYGMHGGGAFGRNRSFGRQSCDFKQEGVRLGKAGKFKAALAGMRALNRQRQILLRLGSVSRH
jgi:hypothetical protein